MKSRNDPGVWSNLRVSLSDVRSHFCNGPGEALEGIVGHAVVDEKADEPRF